MTRQIGLLTLVCCFVITGSALAQREVPPPSNTPFNEQPAGAQTKAAAKPAQAAKAPEKVKKNTLPAPVQAATVPTTTECKPAPAENKADKAKANAKDAAAKATEKKSICPVAAKASGKKPVAARPAGKKPATAEKSKKTRSVKICDTTGPNGQSNAAQGKKESLKTAHKTTQKRVIRATTVPVE
jgi:hypothetical protein